MKNSEMMARAFCREVGMDEEAYVCREVPMTGPSSLPMHFHYIPSPDRQIPAWQLFLPMAQIALSLIGKLKIAEE